MTYFEMINLTHKPKLVAVTSCREGAGVTSTAAGLASSLSETGDGNVLLVNMNVRDGEAHHFYKGKLNCGLDDVFEKGTRESALVQGHLYVAKELPERRPAPPHFAQTVQSFAAQDEGQRLRLHYFRHASRQPNQHHPQACPVYGYGVAGH